MKVLVFGPGDDTARIEKANAVNKKNGPFDKLILLGENTAKDLQCDVPVESIKDEKAVTISIKNPENTSYQSILATADWPLGMEEGDEKSTGTESIKELVQKTQPRYHFTSNSTPFYEKQPYKWEDSGRYTRFINLDKFGGNSKWFYAFDINENENDDAAPHGLADNPWSRKRRTDTDTTDPLPKKKKKEKKRKEPKQKVITPENCFFCLSCPQLDKELIVSIADESYMALAKGPLTTSQNTQMDCPGHVLIIPIAHVPSFSMVQDNSQVALERKKYRIALKQLYESYNLIPVEFEISRAKGVHAHSQIIPIPKDKKSEVESLFTTEAEKYGMSIVKRNLDPDETEYFRVILPNDESMVIEIATTGKFDLQFGRKVMAKLLNLENRIDWRACAQTATEEAKDSAQFKSLFKDYDFTL